MLNEDAMATEKLAEGIRTFAKDLGTCAIMSRVGWRRRRKRPVRLGQWGDLAEYMPVARNSVGLAP